MFWIFEGFSNCEGGIKKSDAQVHLQRKIQEKELIKEQKKKLQEQRSSLSTLNKGKSGSSKKKSIKSKKSKLTASEVYDLSSFCVVSRSFVFFIQSLYCFKGRMFRILKL